MKKKKITVIIGIELEDMSAWNMPLSPSVRARTGAFQRALPDEIADAGGGFERVAS